MLRNWKISINRFLKIAAFEDMDKSEKPVTLEETCNFKYVGIGSNDKNTVIKIV